MNGKAASAVVRLNLNIYGLQHVYGLLPKGSSPIRVPDLVREAQSLGFQGAEIPAAVLESASAADLREARAQAEEHDLELVVSVEGTDPEWLKRVLGFAEALGSRMVRTVVGGAGFGGDRRAMMGRWQAFMREVRDRLTPTIALAERAGVYVAAENHQDLASEDLAWLCKSFETEHFGVTLDTANALAVAEHPLDFLAAVIDYVKYVHLKDYVIYWTDAGYLLVRCSVGGGVVPLAEMQQRLLDRGSPASAGLELAALEARHVRCLMSDFWPDYERRSASQFARVVAFVRQHARPEGEDHRTPFERGASPEVIATYEREQYRESIRRVLELMPTLRLRWHREHAAGDLG